MGWLGSRSELLNVLRTFGADTDEDGNFLIYRAGVASFMGAGEEFVVSDDAEYSVQGVRRNLAAALNATSYGVRGITVIM